MNITFKIPSPYTPPETIPENILLATRLISTTDDIIDTIPSIVCVHMSQNGLTVEMKMCGANQITEAITMF